MTKIKESDYFYEWQGIANCIWSHQHIFPSVLSKFDSYYFDQRLQQTFNTLVQKQVLREALN